MNNNQKPLIIGGSFIYNPSSNQWENDPNPIDLFKKSKFLGVLETLRQIYPESKIKEEFATILKTSGEDEESVIFWTNHLLTSP